MMWNEKYRPKKVSDVQGQDKAIKELKDFVINKKKGAALVYGPTGTGKTCSVYAIANELNYDVLEVNASDFRNKAQIESVVGGAVKQLSLFSRDKIILIDEVDGISGQKDRGGVQALIKLLGESSFPIIITSNDPYEQKISSLRSKCQLIEFHSLNYLSVLHVLKNICGHENIKYDEKDLKSLAMRAGGDLRGAINDLQAICLYKNELDNIDAIDDREKTESIFNALQLIFKSKKIDVVHEVFNKTDLDLNEAMLWIDENLPLEYNNESLNQAYYYISRADMFNGRIKRWQHWRFLVYVNALLSCGVALAKDEKNKNFVKYKRTSRILKIWKANMRNTRRNSIAEKIALHSHISVKRAIKESLPYLKGALKKDEEFCKELDLSEEEIEWLNKQ